jgi:hypothetical protein
MGWLFFGKLSNSPRSSGPRLRRQKPRLQLEHLEERIVLDNRFQVPTGPLIDLPLNDKFATADLSVPAVHADVSGTISDMANNQNNLRVSSVVDDEVVISANAAGAIVSAVIAVNPIKANGFGAGTTVEQGPDQTSVFRPQSVGSYFPSSSIGVFVPPPGDASTASVAGFELGRGNEGSVASSEFQTFSSPVTTASGAFAGSVEATGRGIGSPQPSHFTNGLNSHVVALERNKKPGALSPLASNAALLDSIFENLTRVAGNSTNAMDAGSLVNTLNTASMTPTAVANDLLHSGGGIGGLVAQVFPDQNQPIRTIKEKRRLRQPPGSKSISDAEGT